MVGGIQGVGYGSYTYNPIQYMYGASVGTNADAVSNVPGMSGVTGEEDDAKKKVTGTEKKGECEACKNRKYVDGSDEMVSFKAPAKISANAAPGAVRAHEQEHVSNAYIKAAKGNGKVIQASVTMKMAICPECGRAYIAGGQTNTKIKYSEDNPYSKNQKSANYNAVAGSNIDAAV